MTSPSQRTLYEQPRAFHLCACVCLRTVEETMHNQAYTVPAFLTKLKLLVDDTETEELIYWDPSGRSFHIRDGNRLAKEVLPLFFKHNNLSSFVRQLNMYGFRKINRADVYLGTSGDGEDMEFSHPFFIRGNDALLTRIHRKPPSYTLSNNMLSNQLLMGSAAVSSTGLNQHAATARANRVILSSEFNRLAEIVKQMRARQEWTTHQLHLVRSENQLLYRELALLRSQHEQQSQLIQTLFNFFSAIATESRPSSIRIGAVKRKLALPEPSDSNKKRNQVDTSKVIYSLEPSILAEPARLATESPFQDLLFAHPPVHSSDVQPNSDTVGNSADVLARYSLPRVRLLSQDVLSTGQVLPHSQSITSAPILSIREVPQSGSSPVTDASPSGSPTTSGDKITCTGSATTEIGKPASPSKTNAVRRILPKSASARILSTKSHSNAVLPQTRPISPSIVVNLADMMEAKSFDLDDLAYSTYFQDPGLDGGVPFDPQGFDYEPGDLLTPPQRSPQSPQQDENLDANTLFPDSFLLNDEVAQAENSLKGPPSGRLTRRKSAARRLPNSLVARDPDANGVGSYLPPKKTTTERTSATSKSRLNGLPPSVDSNDLNSLSPLHAGELTSILENTGVITGASGDEASDIPTLQSSSSSSMVASLPWEDVAAQETVVDGNSAALLGDSSNDNADVFKTRTASSLTEKIPPSSIPSPSYNIAHLNNNGVVNSPVTRAGGKVGGISGLNTPTILESFSQLPSPATPDAVVGGLLENLFGNSPATTGGGSGNVSPRSP